MIRGIGANDLPGAVPYQAEVKFHLIQNGTIAVPDDDYTHSVFLGLQVGADRYRVAFRLSNAATVVADGRIGPLTRTAVQVALQHAHDRASSKIIREEARQLALRTTTTVGIATNSVRVGELLRGLVAAAPFAPPPADATQVITVAPTYVDAPSIKPGTKSRPKSTGSGSMLLAGGILIGLVFLANSKGKGATT